MSSSKVPYGKPGPRPPCGSVLLLLFSVSLVIWVFLPSQQSSAREYYSDFVPGPLSGKCDVCHSGSSLDKFGLDFGAVPNHESDPNGAFQTLANLDSDGDGFTNQEELMEGTYPGDSSSFPAGADSVELPLLPLFGLSASMLLAAVVIFCINRRSMAQTSSRDGTSHRSGHTSPALEALENDYKSGLVDQVTYDMLKEEYSSLSRNDHEGA